MPATTMRRFGRQNEFADVVRQIERDASVAHARACTVWSPLLTVLLFSTLLFISSLATAAAGMRGDQFITMMDGNTLSGTGPAGSPFNLYFLPGGHVTYAGRAGTAVQGTWELDKNGDVCVRWPRAVDAITGCFAVAAYGSHVSWRAKGLGGHGTLRGDAVETFLEGRTADRRGHEPASQEFAQTKQGSR